MAAQSISFMSQEEQDAILGRATREYRELQTSLALIDAELDTFADDLLQLMGYVNKRVRLIQHHDTKHLQKFPERVSKYIDPAKLMALIEEQDRLAKRIGSVHLTLKSLGQ